MYIPDKDDFQPSPETLNKWLATRKPTHNVGGNSIPGFFSDTGNSSDTKWFFLGVIGEVVGFLTTLYGGARSGGQFFFFALLAILMSIFCDYFFAVKLHRKKAIESRLRSMEFLRSDSDIKTFVELGNKLSQGKGIDFLLRTGIIVIAIAKIIGIVLLGIFNNLTLYVPFAIIYFIVAYIHLKHTGYYFAYIGTEHAINREYRQIGTTDKFDCKQYDQIVQTSGPLRKMPIRHNPHEIINDSAGPNQYVIKTKGVLTDEEILNLITGQEDSNKLALFKACRKLQIENTPGTE